MASAHLLQRLLTRRIEAIAAHLPDALDGQPHAVHQARVASRRLRETVPVVAAALPDRRRRRWRRRLRRLTRALGPVREHDVALHMVETLAAESARVGPSERAALALVRESLVRERDARRALLGDRFAPHDIERLTRRLRALAARLPSPENDRTWREVLAWRLRTRARALHAAIADAGALFLPERLHAVRIAAKKLRYSLELAGEARTAPTAALVRQLKDAQASLGRLHDLDVLRAAVLDVAAGQRPEAAARMGLEQTADRLTGEMRLLHARYLNRQGALIRLADRTLDAIAPRVDAPSAVAE